MAAAPSFTITFEVNVTIAGPRVPDAAAPAAQEIEHGERATSAATGNGKPSGLAEMLTRAVVAARNANQTAAQGRHAMDARSATNEENLG